MRATLQLAIGIDNDDDITVTAILDRIQEHVRGKRNITLDRVALEERLSPAQILFGHPLRSVVPAHRQSFASRWQKTADEQDASCRQAHARNEERYNRQSRPLPQRCIGTQVRLQNPITKKWDRVGVIIGIGRHRDYHVKLRSGRVYWRNRRFVKPDIAQSEENYLRVDNNVEPEGSDTGHTERYDIPSSCRNEPRRSKRQRVPPSKLRLLSPPRVFRLKKEEGIGVVSL